MRSLNKLLLTGSTAGLVVLGWSTSPAVAQPVASDTNPTLPNVLLLVDTSGQMQLTLDGNHPVSNCDPASIPGGLNERSRWSLVLEALTGSLPQLTCNGAGEVGSRYDTGFNDVCYPGKNTPNPSATSLTNPWDWGTDPSAPLEARSAICNVDQNSPNCCKTGPGGWEQNNDGAIDLFGQRIRFALMTSDLGTHSDADNPDHNSPPNLTRERWRLPPSTRLDSGGFSFPPYRSYTPVSSGGYSYWWNGGGNWTSGTSAGSAFGNYGFAAAPPSLKPWEVGVRNRDAEPWEGRMMGFGNNGISASDLQQQSDRIQQVLLATHPHYSAPSTSPWPGDLTPMAGMLSDASDFIMNDTDSLPGYPLPSSFPNFLMGPKNDPAAACRSTDVVVIAGGGIGLDMMDPNVDGFVHAPTNWEASFTPPCLTPLTPWLCSGPVAVPVTSCNDPTLLAGGVCPYAAGGQWGSTFLNNIYNYVQLTGGAAHIMAVTKHTGVTYDAPACIISATGTSPACKVNCEDIAQRIINFHDFSDYTTPGAACYATPDPVTQAMQFSYDNTGDAKGVLAACCELAYLSDAMHEPTQFIDSPSQMKQGLANIAIRAAGRTTSRVEPSFSTAAPTIDKTVAQGGTGSNPTAAGPGGQIVAASFEVNGGLVSVPNLLLAANKIDMWYGRLERRRFTCSNAGSPVPVAANITAAQGDDFANNLVTGFATRKFFTVVGQQPFGNNAPKVQRSIRINQAGYDATLGLTNPVSDNLNALVTTIAANQTPLDLATHLATRIDTALTLGATQHQDVLGISGKDNTKCSSEFGPGNSGPSNCGDQALQWFGGVEHPSGTFVAGVASPYRNDRCPPGVCAWVDPNNINAHPMGAIYHSQPVTVGPPLDFLNDESYRTTFAPPDNPLTAPNGQGNRPTVLYSQTIDGMLHAFVVAKNSGSTGLYASVPSPDGSELNELWSFIPPIMLPQIWPNYNSHAVLLDGGIAVADTVVRRSAANVKTGTGNWHTILVGSGGESSAGGFYYALDVTNPLSPQFLWQLSTAGDNQGSANGPVPLFGPSVPPPAIATVTVGAAGSLNQVAVAILAGGSAGFPAPTLDKLGNPIDTPRRGAGGSNARVRIRNWGDSVPARSVTIVELGTGKVLKRFEGQLLGTAGTPGDLPTNDPGHVLNGPNVRDDTPGLDSPMTGTPVAFPNSPGVAANRAYIGDADGTMWRIDLSDTNPVNWKMSIAWDAYGGDTSIAGQPIETAPLISTDLSGIPVVVFSTGAADGFTDYSAGMTNWVLSFRDAPGGAPGAFIPATTGFHTSYPNGERVTGPMALFNGTVYFSTFRPALSPGVCAVGQAFISGLNYLTGADQLDVDDNGTFDGPQFAIGGAGTVIFGAQLARVPSCSAGATTGSDGWMSGAYKSETTTATGSYQLVFNTGINASSTLTDSIVGATGAQTGTTNVMHLKMAAPKALVRLHSWASVSE